MDALDPTRWYASTKPAFSLITGYAKELHDARESVREVTCQTNADESVCTERALSQQKQLSQKRFDVNMAYVKQDPLSWDIRVPETHLDPPFFFSEHICFRSSGDGDRQHLGRVDIEVPLHFQDNVLRAIKGEQGDDVFPIADMFRNIYASYACHHASAKRDGDINYIFQKQLFQRKLQAIITSLSEPEEKPSGLTAAMYALPVFHSSTEDNKELLTKNFIIDDTPHTVRVERIFFEIRKEDTQYNNPYNASPAKTEWYNDKLRKQLKTEFMQVIISSTDTDENIRYTHCLRFFPVHGKGPVTWQFYGKNDEVEYCSDAEAVWFRTNKQRFSETEVMALNLRNAGYIKNCLTADPYKIFFHRQGQWDMYFLQIKDSFIGTIVLYHDRVIAPLSNLPLWRTKNNPRHWDHTEPFVSVCKKLIENDKDQKNRLYLQYTGKESAKYDNIQIKKNSNSTWTVTRDSRADELELNFGTNDYAVFDDGSMWILRDNNVYQAFRDAETLPHITFFIYENNVLFIDDDDDKWIGNVRVPAGNYLFYFHRQIYKMTYPDFKLQNITRNVQGVKNNDDFVYFPEMDTYLYIIYDRIISTSKPDANGILTIVGDEKYIVKDKFFVYLLELYEHSNMYFYFDGTTYFVLDNNYQHVASHYNKYKNTIEISGTADEEDIPLIEENDSVCNLEQPKGKDLLLQLIHGSSVYWDNNKVDVNKNEDIFRLYIEGNQWHIEYNKISYSHVKRDEANQWKTVSSTSNDIYGLYQSTNAGDDRLHNLQALPGRYSEPYELCYDGIFTIHSLVKAKSKAFRFLMAVNHDLPEPVASLLRDNIFLLKCKWDYSSYLSYFFRHHDIQLKLTFQHDWWVWEIEISYSGSFYRFTKRHNAQGMVGDYTDMSPASKRHVLAIEEQSSTHTLGGAKSFDIIPYQTTEAYVYVNRSRVSIQDVLREESLSMPIDAMLVDDVLRSDMWKTTDNFLDHPDIRFFFSLIEKDLDSLQWDGSKVTAGSTRSFRHSLIEKESRELKWEDLKVTNGNVSSDRDSITGKHKNSNFHLYPSSNGWIVRIDDNDLYIAVTKSLKQTGQYEISHRACPLGYFRAKNDESKIISLAVDTFLWPSKMFLDIIHISRYDDPLDIIFDTQFNGKKEYKQAHALLQTIHRSMISIKRAASVLKGIHFTRPDGEKLKVPQTSVSPIEMELSFAFGGSRWFLTLSNTSTGENVILETSTLEGEIDHREHPFGYFRVRNMNQMTVLRLLDDNAQDPYEKKKHPLPVVEDVSEKVFQTNSRPTEVSAFLGKSKSYRFADRGVPRTLQLTCYTDIPEPAFINKYTDREVTGLYSLVINEPYEIQYNKKGYGRADADGFITSTVLSWKKPRGSSRGIWKITKWKDTPHQYHQMAAKGQKIKQASTADKRKQKQILMLKKTGYLDCISGTYVARGGLDKDQNVYITTDLDLNVPKEWEFAIETNDTGILAVCGYQIAEVSAFSGKYKQKENWTDAYEMETMNQGIRFKITFELESSRSVGHIMFATICRQSQQGMWEKVQKYTKHWKDTEVRNMIGKYYTDDQQCYLDVKDIQSVLVVMKDNRLVPICGATGGKDVVFKKSKHSWGGGWGHRKSTITHKIKVSVPRPRLRATMKRRSRRFQTFVMK